MLKLSHIELIRRDENVKVAFHYESSNIKNDPELKNWVDQLGAWLVKNGFADNSFANVIGYDQVVYVGETNKTLNRLVSLVTEFEAALSFPLK